MIDISSLETALAALPKGPFTAEPADPALNMETYDRTVKALLDQSIIKATPEGAYTTVVTDALK